jgi:uncharacterized protein YydD (DUF2326 family)
MLAEIRSEQFRVKQIHFHKGLNVVLGDENATNSIGKSTLLMVIDFAFGGTSLLEHNSDLTKELGHHDYFISFQFDGESYRFRRGTSDPEAVSVCDEDYQPTDDITLDQYTAFLKTAYKIDIEDISFRSLVGLYLRVWGKDNLNVYKPLHVVQTQSGKDCVNNLIKTFGLYSPIKDVTQLLRERDEEREALSAAFRNRIIPKIGKREHAENQKKITALSSELEEIKRNLARYATSIGEIVNKEMLELKVQKDELLETKLQLEGQLIRVKRNLTGNRHIESRHFAGLVKFFPTIDQSRLLHIEEFHSGVAKLLKVELEETRDELTQQLARINEELADIDKKMSTALASIDKPAHVVDRVFELASSLRGAKAANDFFEQEQTLREIIDELRIDLTDKKTAVLQSIEKAINSGLQDIVAIVFGSDRKSPLLRLSENSYSYEIYEDTGTGTAYAGLIVFDLTIFQLTHLPFIAHDSLLFKNIENDSVANLFNVYSSITKQSFAAIDEVSKYGPTTAAMLIEQSVIQLDDRNVLYIKDWRSKSP